MNDGMMPPPIFILILMNSSLTGKPENGIFSSSKTRCRLGPSFLLSGLLISWQTEQCSQVEIPPGLYGLLPRRQFLVRPRATATVAASESRDAQQRTLFHLMCAPPSSRQSARRFAARSTSFARRTLRRSSPAGRSCHPASAGRVLRNCRKNRPSHSKPTTVPATRPPWSSRRSPHPSPSPMSAACRRSPADSRAACKT